jgi:hypothetical protein
MREQQRKNSLPLAFGSRAPKTLPAPVTKSDRRTSPHARLGASIISTAPITAMRVNGHGRPPKPQNS